MPFIYSEPVPGAEAQYDDDVAPAVEDFVYIPVPDWFGGPDPVRFSLAPGAGEDAWRQQLFAIAIPGLRHAGVRRAYCRYDGGQDEGFSWPDAFEMRDGERLSVGDLAERLKNAAFLEAAARAFPGFFGRARGSSTGADTARCAFEMLCEDAWTPMLLGRGYGTGAYLMYGAFTVDLDTCTITDDRSAEPVVRNIDLDTGDLDTGA